MPCVRRGGPLKRLTGENMNEKAWCLIETQFDMAQNTLHETLFAQGNGYIGLRGTLEEGVEGPSTEGTYINGFFESEPITYGEKFHGYPDTGQTMLNVANGKVIRVMVDGESLSMTSGTLLNYERIFDMKRGILMRRFRWQSPGGKVVQGDIERLVLFQHKHVALIRYAIRPLNFDGAITIFSGVDGAVANLSADDDPRVSSGFVGEVLWLQEKKVGENTAVLTQRTHNTNFTLGCGIHNHLESGRPFTAQPINDNQLIGHEYHINAAQDQPIILTKIIAYTTDLETPTGQVISDVEVELERATVNGYDALKREQSQFMADFWYRTDIQIEGDDKLQLGLRFNMVHLLQSTGRDGRTNIAAKGLTGQGYEGHTFWDTEIYILPFFLYSHPDISRSLLEYRYHMLDAARARAREMAHQQGALFPWRTISGAECSPYYPGGTAQYHINADIAFAVKRYYDATLDTQFMCDYGAEMLFETARLWLDTGAFIPALRDKFCINGVTGPDEYTAVVNNNAYTNLMARENLRFACEIASWLGAEHPAIYLALAAKINLEADETAVWQQAADQMFIPYDEERGIIAQDDTFLQKPVWDFANTPSEQYPLLLHYHPLVLYRYQVCKQADTILAEFLLHDQFDRAQKKRDFDYYEPITTHDSSLSTCIFGIMAAELGYDRKSYLYFIETATADLENKKGNTKDGIHAANMAGAWMSITFGFAGMRVADGLSFNPTIPKAWQRYTFRVSYRGRLIEVDVSHEGTEYRLIAGGSVDITHQGQLLPVPIKMVNTPSNL